MCDRLWCLFLSFGVKNIYVTAYSLKERSDPVCTWSILFCFRINYFIIHEKILMDHNELFQ